MFLPAEGKHGTFSPNFTQPGSSLLASHPRRAEGYGSSTPPPLRPSVRLRTRDLGFRQGRRLCLRRRRVAHLFLPDMRRTAARNAHLLIAQTDGRDGHTGGGVLERGGRDSPSRIQS